MQVQSMGTPAPGMRKSTDCKQSEQASDIKPHDSTNWTLGTYFFWPHPHSPKIGAGNSRGRVTPPAGRYDYEEVLMV